MKLRIKPSARLSVLLGSTLAIASAAANAGGLDSGTTAVTNFEVWLYALGGILAICYLLWVGFQCWSNKADWVHDFGGAIAKVAAVGAASVLAPWAWTLFTS